ncbi:MAG: filamentous hemagglutinin N-terminal domain-containing protein [Cyanobacteria bacterium P01_F01_bin.150]
MVRLLSRCQVVIIGLFISTINLYPLPSLAQISPDQTLGDEASVLHPDTDLDGVLVDLINGGATRETNLFHSFEHFNVSESQQVYFDSPSGIDTILTRVTGNRASNIMGTLGVNGGADLFLLNPNGIVFSTNAQLDVGGSFIATTADAFQFESMGTFSGREPDLPSSLLTIAPSAFLFGQEAAGSIVNQSTIAATYDDLPDAVMGLRVPNGETLGLLGGDVLIDGGWLSALGGRIEIGSVVGDGTISLSENSRFQFLDTVHRGEVRFQNDAVADAALRGGGNIRVMAATIDIMSSLLQTGIRAGEETSGRQAGKILLDATERIRLRGGTDRSETDNLQSFGISNNVEQDSIGDAGLIKVISPILTIRNGAQINASVFGGGNAGRVIIEASDRVTAAGTSALESSLSGIFSSVEQGGVGHAGRIQITTPILRVRDGARISSSVNGSGDGGNIKINVSDQITLDGASTTGSNASGVFSTLDMGGVGSAGRIKITTPILNVQNGARINSSTLGQGDGGSVIISATQYISIEGRTDDDDENSFSRIASEAFYFGDSNNESNEEENTDSNALFPQSNGIVLGNAGRIAIATPVLNLTDGAQITSASFSAGDGGNIIIDAANQIHLDDGLIKASSLQDSFGQAGDITITTELATVENDSQLLSTTGDTTGGNISLDLDNLFLLSGSRIAAASGAEGSGGDGGNIVIGADFIVTLANQDSDIDANAYSGNGGNITIEAENLFNIEFQEQQLTPRNDITVSSAFGLDGEVTIESPNIDPSRGTTTLPTNLIASLPLDAVCHSQNGNHSQFVMAGRGGLPSAPTGMLNGVTVLTPWVVRDRSTSFLPSTPTSNQLAYSSGFIEAEHWETDKNGKVVLVTSSHVTSQERWPTHNLCAS